MQISLNIFFLGN